MVGTRQQATGDTWIMAQCETKQRMSFKAWLQKHGSLLLFVMLGTLFWAIWNESASFATLLTGAALSWLAINITNRYLLKDSYQQTFRIHPIRLLHYIGVLILAIFESGIHAMYITITGRIDVHIVDLPTGIQNPFHGVLVANAITLTPGTVTIDHSKGSFKVIWIESPTHDVELAGEMIKGRFERVLEPKLAEGLS